MGTRQLPIERHKHKIDIQVRFNDFDMFGHLNNNAYLEYCDLAKAEFFQYILGGPVSPKQLSVVVANLNVNFFAPTLPGELLSVYTHVRHIGDSSFTLEQDVINPETRQLKAQAQTVMVSFNIKTLQSTPLPESLRNRLSEHLPE